MDVVSTPISRRWERGAGLLLLVGITLLAYVAVGRVGWIYEDPRWHPWAPIGITWGAWPSRAFTLQTLAWQVGWSTSAVHLSQLLLHVSTGLLLYGVLRALPLPRLIAGLTCAIFLLHPLQQEAVTYLTARTDVLATGWILVAVWCGLQTPSWIAALGTVGALLAAGFSKELGLLGVPLVLWALWAWRPASRRLVVGLGSAGLAVLLVVYHARILVWLTLPANVGGSQWPWGAWLQWQLCAIGRFLGLLVWPQGFSIDHDPVGSSRLWGLVPLLVPLIGWRWREHRMVRWLIGSVLIALVPRLVIRQYEFIAEHQMYLAMVWLSLGLAVAGSALYRWAVARDAQAVDPAAVVDQAVGWPLLPTARSRVCVATGAGTVPLSPVCFMRSV